MIQPGNPANVQWVSSSFFSPNSFSYRGSYFKYKGEGSQILWIRFGRGLSGRVSAEVSSECVRMGEGSQILIRFGRGLAGLAPRFVKECS